MRYGELVSLTVADTPPCLLLLGDFYWIRRAVEKLTSEIDDFDKSLACGRFQRRSVGQWTN